MNIMTTVAPTPAETLTDRQEVLSRLGNVLQQHLEQKEALPQTPFTSALLEAAQKFAYYEVDSDTDKVYRMVWKENDESTLVGKLESTIGDAALKTKWASSVENTDGEAADDEMVKYRAALSYARTELSRSKKTGDRLKAVLIPAVIAMEFKPEAWTPDQKVVKHKNESEEEKIFRTAWRDLASMHKRDNKNTDAMDLYYAYVRALTESHLSLGEMDTYIVEAVMDPENEELREGYMNAAIAELSSRLSDIIGRPEFTADGFREEMYILQRRDHESKRAEEEPDLPIEETKWTILPPGTLEELGEGDGRDHEATPNYVDPERMKWLARLAMQWGGGAYIAVSNLDSRGHYDYRVAVLPEEKNGVITEHAIAENPSSGNAIYVFRGERGLEDDGKTHWLTWQQVLSDTKAGARALGARRILHGNHTDENVLEYLTRPAADLDKSGYKR